VEQLTDIVDKLKLPVLAYGLRSDFRGEPFEGSMYLLVWEIISLRIKTICHCGKKAIMNTRIDAQGKPVKTGDQIHIGGNDKYIAMCRKHFKTHKLLLLAMGFCNFKLRLHSLFLQLAASIPTALNALMTVAVSYL